MVPAAIVHEHSDRSEGAALSSPFCFDCGYDLQGLELPRACPECGRVNDPEADVCRIREWFAHRSAAIGWILRPRRIPAGTWYMLYDPTSLQVARQRERVWLWLPVILSAVTVALGCLITIEYDTKVSYYKRTDPQRRPLRIVNESETDRLYAFNLHFRWSLLFSKPASWVQVVERQRKRVGVSVPDDFDPTFLFWGCSPGFVVIFGYWPARAVTLHLAKYAAKSRDRPELRRASHAASTLMATPVGISVWLWFGTSVLYALSKLLLPGEVAWYFVGGLLFTAAGLWVLACVIGYATLLRQDRARLIIANRLVGCAALTAVSIGGPAAVIWALVEAFS